MIRKPKRRMLALSILPLVVAAAGHTGLPSSQKPRLAYAYTISVLSNTAVLQDVSKDGLALVAGFEPSKDWVKSPRNPSARWAVLRPKLVTWSTKACAVASALEWKTREQELPESCRREYSCIVPRQLKFYEDESKALGIQGPWLVLVDLKSSTEIRRVLPSQDYLDPRFPGFCCGNLPNGYALLAINPHDNSVAAAFNADKQPRLFLFDSGLSKPVKSWPLPRYVADICWSPDGRSLAVLYSGQFDEKWEFHGIDAGFTTVHLPDVEILDPSSDKRTVLKFFTGATEAKIRYSKDGDLLYCITQSSVLSDLLRDWSKDVIRVFSAQNGNLVRTISGGSSGIRNNFVFSPSERLIVADASRDARWNIFLSLEPPEGVKRERFVVIDVKTGKVIYARHRTMPGDFRAPMSFAFSADEWLLFVDPNNGQIEVYSLAAQE